MNKIHTKVICGLLAVMLAVAALCGCSTSTEKEQNVTGTTSQSQSQESQTTQAAGYVPQKDLEITVWDTQGSDAVPLKLPKEDIPGKWLKEKTRVSIGELYGNGGQQWDSKLMTLVASGNLPHVLTTWAKEGPAHHAKLHEGDLNWELTPEMLQKYAPHVYDFIPEYAWESIKIDGKIYGIPYAMPVDREVDPSVPADFIDYFGSVKDNLTWTGGDSCLFIRDDIAKKIFPSVMTYDEAINIAQKEHKFLFEEFVFPIKTTEEYVKFMYDIKALNLQEGNKPVYATGYAAEDNWNALSLLGAEMMGYKNYNYTGFWSIPQNKMCFGYLEPVVREAAKLQTKMIRDKVIDPESLLHDAAKFKEKVLNGQYAFAWMNIGDIPRGIDDVNDILKEQGKTYKYMPFLTQVPNRPEYPMYKEGPPNFLGTLSFFKTLKEEELYQVLNYVDTLFTEEWEEIKWWGPKEAGLYEELPDGKRQYKDTELWKFLVTGEESKITDNTDAKGLGSSYNHGFTYPVSKWPLYVSKWHPLYTNKIRNWSSFKSVYKVSADSKYAQGLVLLPEVQSWAAPYANIPEIQELWSKRGVWDDPFKVTLTAKSDEEFDKKWDAAIANFKKTLDVDKMLEEQTKIALPLVEKVKKPAN